MRLDTRDDTFYNAEGEKLTLPITKTVADKQTLVYDSVSDGKIVNDTRGLVLEDGTTAMSYELRFPTPREWKLATFEDGEWTHGLPMPGTQTQSLVDTEGNPIDTIEKIEELTAVHKTATAAVIYKNKKRETVFAIAKSNKKTGIKGQDWKVKKVHLALSGTGMQMQAVRDDAGEAVGVVIK